jgi:hypothetical protein
MTKNKASDLKKLSRVASHLKVQFEIALYCTIALIKAAEAVFLVLCDPSMNKL